MSMVVDDKLQRSVNIKSKNIDEEAIEYNKNNRLSARFGKQDPDTLEKEE